MKTTLDEFDQFAVLEVKPTPAAATGTVLQQLVTGLTNMQKVAWEVSRIEFAFPASVFVDMVTSADEILVGITQSNNVVQDLSLRGAAMIDNFQLNLELAAPLVTDVMHVYEQPFIHEFKNPRLVLPQMLFMFATWAFTNPITGDPIVARMWYRERDLTPEDWYDLLQLRLPLGAS